ncbi:MAG: hypothetical protein PHQ86_07315 [Dehalococcoidales bacterium]|nr:hypothetical protein [Dehalococcoidales bacterium]
MASIVAVCSSKKKGTKKVNITAGILNKDYGLVSDAHADCSTHRQVSLLAIESIKKMQDLGFAMNPGDFAENLTTEGNELVSLPVGTQNCVGEENILEIIQIG